MYSFPIQTEKKESSIAPSKKASTRAALRIFMQLLKMSCSYWHLRVLVRHGNFIATTSSKVKLKLTRVQLKKKTLRVQVCS